MTAAELYAKRLASCRSLLCDISDALEVHQASQLDHVADWGFVGDVAHVEEMLLDVAVFLGIADRGDCDV